MMTNTDDKIKNAFAVEFENAVFDVYSENGQVNQNIVLYTVFVDKSEYNVEKFSEEEQEAIIQFAKLHVFDEIFQSEKDDYSLVFYGLIIQ
jgi:hypothetical protein